ncbi:BatD family protein [Gilvimarinus agarilyticus]|uniref:BatD family protein n=1 Tax=Gilvimarinus sp. 2_MG-2023 TaxID=3062666 RepID=UPI001C091354|nr:BatD family protein [Gilvimarinus sp. 2_MG-2023]MBU2886995.1 BatD family protein [Gilvimarinus agarilyticus]MDO6571655.1 BatD family protein [Gilvimarinus sp. 2_MG-2023]
MKILLSKRYIQPFKLIIISAIVLLAQLANAATFTAEAARTNININDQLTVNFRLQNGPDNVEPDLSPVQSNFEILNIERRQESYTVNRETNEFLTWRVTLAPKHVGKLTIPAIALAGSKTQPLTITVVEAPTTASDPNAETFLEISADQQSVFVQQQVLLTACLYSKYDWTGKEIGDFNLDYALIEAVSEDEYITELNGIRHKVYEVTFAVYPQSSGRLEIPAIDYAVQLRSGSSRGFLSFNSGPIRRGKAQPLSIEVKSIPQSNGNDTWLPAQQLELSQHFSRTPDNLTAGEPITRRITISAEGLHPTQLPPLEFAEVEGFSIYRDKAQTDETRSNKGINASRIETLAMVPNQAGQTQLPPITLRWYNTSTGRFETATLPSVEVSASLPAGSTPTDQGDIAAPPPQAFIPAKSDQTTIVERIPTWIIVSQVISVLCILILLPMALRKKSASAPSPQSKQTSSKTEWSAVQKAAKNNDLKQLRGAIIAWAKQHLQVEVHTLAELAQLSDQTTQEQLTKLDQAIYGSASADLKLDELLKGLRKLKNQPPKTSDNLRPLYPQ